MGKSKKDKRQSEGGEDDVDKKEVWLEKLKYLSPIAQPLAPRKLTKRLLKTCKKAIKEKKVKLGVKVAQKSIRKGEKGIMLLAGDVFPIDCISHFPVICEEAGIPYCYIPTKEDLGSGCGVRTTVAALVKPHENYQESYDECHAEMSGLPTPI